MSRVTKMTVKTKPVWRQPKGPRMPRNGAGAHGDRRLKRLRTRGDQLRQAMKAGT